jgi:predicted aspartyl protease
VGMFKVKVRVSNSADPSRFFEEDFWVDTGAYYSFAPGDRLEEIGLHPHRSKKFILADGRQEQLQVGDAMLTIPQLDDWSTCPIVFAPAGSLYLLGATTLEIFAVQADPVTEQLRPLTAIIIA